MDTPGKNHFLFQTQTSDQSAQGGFLHSTAHQQQSHFRVDFQQPWHGPDGQINAFVIVEGTDETQRHAFNKAMLCSKTLVSGQRFCKPGSFNRVGNDHHRAGAQVSGIDVVLQSLANRSDLLGIAKNMVFKRARDLVAKPFRAAGALVHGGIANDTKVALQYISADSLEDGQDLEKLDNCDGILVPGGFGSRGMEGKIQAVTYARERSIPFFGICLGMQLAVVEFARNIARIEGAHSVEFNLATPHPVIYLMTEWFDFRSGRIERRDEQSDMGGTLRLGAYPCALTPGTLASAAYGQETISERHRHRYEFNNAYREQLEAAGLVVSGASPDGNLVEIIELADHPWFLGCQFHPEFQSKPMRPHPLFRDFIKAAIAHHKGSPA